MRHARDYAVGQSLDWIFFKGDLMSSTISFMLSGWFHEVTSYSNSSSSTPNDGDSNAMTHAKSDGQIHMAFNYWFWPPDHLDSSSKGFAKPYISNYWPDLWRRRKQRYSTLRRKNEHLHDDHSKRKRRIEIDRDTAFGDERLKQCAARNARFSSREHDDHDHDLRSLLDRLRSESKESHVVTTRLPDTEECHLDSSRRESIDRFAYAMFGIGRRQHLRCFVSHCGRVRGRASKS